MDTINFKMDEAMTKRMDALIKEHQYGTRTEFIRSAVRDKMTQLEKDTLMKEVLKVTGSGTKTSNAELRRIRDEAWKEYSAERRLK